MKPTINNVQGGFTKNSKEDLLKREGKISNLPSSFSKSLNPLLEAYWTNSHLSAE